MYKEKYLKYKTKYTALKNQLDSNYNIIQDGGVEAICEPILTYDEMEAQKEANKGSLENGTLKVIDYVKKINYSPKKIIINPNSKFYTDNSIETYEITKDILKIGESFIILISSIDLCKNIYSGSVVGLLVNYLDKNKFFVLEYVRGALFFKTYQEVNKRLKERFKIDDNQSTSEFLVNLTNLLKLFKECNFHIKYMQKAQQINEANAEEIKQEINTIIKNIEGEWESTSYTCNLLQLSTLAEYIRET